MRPEIKINKNVWLGVIIIIVCITIIYFFISNTQPSIDQNQFSNKESVLEGEETDILQEKYRWAEIITTIGGEEAYSEFKKEFIVEGEDKQHLMAHLFGETLYEQLKKASDITVCDMNFGFGCFHGFFTAILSDRGNDILPELDQVCVEKFGRMGSGCQHGLGHGLIEYYGHNLKGLNKSLEECKKTTIFGKKFGCTSGAFMEFNLENSLAGKKIESSKRAFDPAKPYFPCPEVKKEFQESCYFELGQFLKNVFRADYAIMGNLCAGVKNEMDKESCYLGIGHIIVPTENFNAEDSVLACQKMPNQDGKLLCLAGVAWEMFSIEKTRPISKDICKTLPKDLFDKCLIKADFIENNGKIFENI